MKLGIHFVNFTLPGGPEALGATLSATAQAAEQVGCSPFGDGSLVPDGAVRQFAGSDAGGLHLVGFLAGLTERMILGVLVTGVTYRHPGLLAKIVTTLDVLSGGRAELGIGAAWYEREHRGLGVPFPPLGERFERLEETLQICHQMWSEDEGPYAGRTTSSPRPSARQTRFRGRAKILVGGSGERKTLRLVAEYADACNLFARDPAVVEHKLEVLARHCDSAGRDPATIQKTILVVGSNPLDDVDGFMSRMEEYARLGVELAEVVPIGPDPVAFVSELGGGGGGEGGGGERRGGEGGGGGAWKGEI